MHINPTILLQLLLIVIFAPFIHQWVTGGETVIWYRPYIIWSVVIVFVWWYQRNHRYDEL